MPEVALIVSLLAVYISVRTHRRILRLLNERAHPRGPAGGVERTCGSPPGNGRGGAGCRKPIGHQDGCAWETDDGILHASDEGLVLVDWQGRSSKVTNAGG